jgi:hypothetical protein
MQSSSELSTVPWRIITGRSMRGLLVGADDEEDTSGATCCSLHARVESVDCNDIWLASDSAPELGCPSNAPFAIHG